MLPTRAFLLATLSFWAFIGGALAQTPPPAATPAASQASATPPKMDCGTKPEHPGRLASDTQRRVWTREANAYLDCYKKYVLNLQQVAQDATKVANDAIDTYNATIKEFEQASKAE